MAVDTDKLKEEAEKQMQKLKEVDVKAELEKKKQQLNDIKSIATDKEKLKEEMAKRTKQIMDIKSAGGLSAVIAPALIFICMIWAIIGATAANINKGLEAGKEKKAQEAAKKERDSIATAEQAIADSIAAAEKAFADSVAAAAKKAAADSIAAAAKKATADSIAAAAAAAAAEAAKNVEQEVEEN